MLNTRLRKDVKNDFEKDFINLMNNSVFGKTMKSIRNRKDMKLVTSDKKYLKYVMKPTLKDGNPFSKDLFAVEMGKTEIKMNKPVNLGQAILDLSKTLSQCFFRVYQIGFSQNLENVFFFKYFHQKLELDGKTFGLNCKCY